MTDTYLTRRALLRRGGTVAGATLLLAACGPAASGTSSPTPAPQTAPPPTSPPAAMAAPVGAVAPTGVPASVAQPTPAVTSSAAAARFQGVVLPTYMPSSTGPTPDLPSTDPNIDPGFNSFPKSPPQATQGTPGKGGEVTFFVGAYYPPATPIDQNPAWQAVNKQLGVDVKMNIVALSDQNTRLATLIAGDDLPDIIHMNSGWAGA